MRRNFLVPVPSFASFEALNAHLERRCLARMDARLRGHSGSIGQRMERDLEALLPLPEAPYDACEKQAGLVSSLSLVRYRTNDYSAPVAYGHRDVLVKGYVDRVVISCGSEVIARRHRSYQRDDFVFDPIHYLPLLELKTAAFRRCSGQMVKSLLGSMVTPEISQANPSKFLLLVRRLPMGRSRGNLDTAKSTYGIGTCTTVLKSMEARIFCRSWVASWTS